MNYLSNKFLQLQVSAIVCFLTFTSPAKANFVPGNTSASASGDPIKYGTDIIVLGAYIAVFGIAFVATLAFSWDFYGKYKEWRKTQADFGEFSGTVGGGVVLLLIIWFLLAAAYIMIGKFAAQVTV